MASSVNCSLNRPCFFIGEEKGAINIYIYIFNNENSAG